MTPKVFIAVPVYGAVEPRFHQSVMRLVMDGASFAMVYRELIGDSLVSRARNSLTAQFLESDCTHLLFIDSDLVFSAEQIERLLSHEKEVVGGFYPLKTEGKIRWCCNASLTPNEADENGLQEVRFMGTGFLLMTRGAIERMRDQYRNQIQYTNDDTGKPEWDLWPVGVYHYADGLRRYLSEDWYFCQRWLDMGGKVFGDTRVILKHVGKAVYPLQSQQEELGA